MADDDLTQQQEIISDQDLPEKLRVHSLARVLGTTSRRVLDALAEFDDRARSAQSSVDQSEAIRVRDLLAARDAAPTEAADDGGPASAAYMPLFVAPQPVIRPAPAAAEATADAGTAETGDDAEEDDEAADGESRPANRRRRRGRRGRGRGRGEQAGDGEDGESDADEDPTADEESAEGSDSDDEGGDEEGGTGEGASRRRRRRRRRKAGSGDDSGDDESSDDPPNTVVHERAPRAKKERERSDEIQGISGSTRLEAKRQRRRDGRDAGRRRPPILSEAEFLARREAVDRVMVVRDKTRTEPPHQGERYTQIAVLEDGIVVEHFVTSASSASLVGNIYLGIVQNVLPSMEAAFVDIGRGRNGVLYAGEVNWEAAGLGGSNRKIEQALKPGDYVVVQVSKDPVGHKGARLTTQVSLAGRYLVYVPGASSTGISRKLPDTERQRLKEILREVVPADAGVIIRTASEGVKEDDIRADVNRLQERWNTIAAKAEEVTAKKAGAAIALYEEPDVLVKVIRDLFNEDFSGLIISGESAWNTITGYVNSVAPELLSKLTKYENPDGPDVFAVHRIDEQLAKAMDRKVWLPSGGTLVIDRTEAMTVVDVNTGKFTGAGGNLEQTVTKNNLEAAEEVVRQLRLRDIGGIVVIDFIDMVLESNRDLVLRRLTEALARDRTRHQVSEVTSLGLVQLTRKRLGTGLIEAFSTTCPECAGRGILMHADPVDNTNNGGGGRKSESGSGSGGGRRGRRGKKGKASHDDEQPEATAVARVPSNAGEHPMFKAMATSTKTVTGEDGDDGEELAEEELAGVAEGTVEDDAIEFAVDDESDEDDDTDEDQDEDDEDEDDEDEDDDIELDEVDEDVIDDDAIEEDEDLEIVDADDDLDDDLEDDEADDEDDADDADDDEDDSEDPQVVAVESTEPAPAGRRPRRRAAARPAGPPQS